MTVAARASSIDYIEDGATLSFAVPFRYIAPDALTAQRAFADGSTASLTYGTDFTATAADTDAGGTLTVAAAAAPGTRLMIRRVTPMVQSAQYPTNDRFPAKLTENAFDTQMMIAQEIGDATDDIAERAPLLPEALAQRAGLDGFMPVVQDGAFAWYDVDALLTGRDPSATSVGRLRIALASAGLLHAVLVALPTDPLDPVRVEWDAGGAVYLGDTLSTWVKGIIGYSDAQMIQLLGITFAAPPKITALGADIFLARIEAAGAGNVEKLFLNLPGNRGDPVNIALSRAPTVTAIDTALAAFVQSTLGISALAYSQLFA